MRENYCSLHFRLGNRYCIYFQVKLLYGIMCYTGELLIFSNFPDSIIISQNFVAEKLVFTSLSTRNCYTGEYVIHESCWISSNFLDNIIISRFCYGKINVQLIFAWKYSSLFATSGVRAKSTQTYYYKPNVNFISIVWSTLLNLYLLQYELRNTPF